MSGKLFIIERHKSFYLAKQLIKKCLHQDILDKVGLNLASLPPVLVVRAHVGDLNAVGQ